MFDRVISELGPWTWMVLGFVLLVMEIIAPGIFMLWIGIAALIIAAISLLIWDAAIWTWQVQVLAFLALSLLSAYVASDGSAGATTPRTSRCSTGAAPNWSAGWQRLPNRSGTAVAASSSATRYGVSPAPTSRPARRCVSLGQPIPTWNSRWSGSDFFTADPPR